MTLLVNKASNSGAQIAAPLGGMPKKAGGRCWSICNGLSRTASLCKGMTGFVADKVSFIPELLSIQMSSYVSKFPPLHTASCVGKERCVRFLLFCGADPNRSIEYGVSSLELACHAGHERIARLLIQSGANVNRVNNLNCSIAHGIPLYNPKIVKLLLAEEINWQSISKIGTSALINLKVARTKNWREVAQAIVDKDPNTAAYANEFLRRKRIGCLFDFGVQSTILRTNGTIIGQTSLHGGNLGGKDFAVQIDKSLKEFSRLAPKTSLEPLLMIRDAFKQNSEVHEDHYDSWHQGKPVILDFETIGKDNIGHYMGVLFWKNYIVICDRGTNTKNLHFYSFDTNSLTPNFLKTLEKDYRGTFRFKGSWDVFNPLKPKPIVPLDKKIILLDQQIGNCNYANKEGLILPFLILFALDGKENNVSDKEVDQTILEQGEVDKNRRSFSQMHVLRDYIDKSDKTVAGGIKPDFDLVANALPYHFSKEFHQKWLKKTHDLESRKMYPGETQPQVPGKEFARCAALHFAQGVYPKVHEKWKEVEAAFLEKAPQESRERYLKHIGKA